MVGASASYTDAWSYTPGATVSVAAEGEGGAQLSLVRLRGLAGGPKPNGYVEETVQEATPIVLQPLHVPAGSYASSATGPKVAEKQVWAWRCVVFPTAINQGSILRWGAVVLSLNAGTLVLNLGGACLKTPIDANVWSALEFGMAHDGLVRLRITPAGPGASYRKHHEQLASGAAHPINGPIEIGRGFNGKISGPSLEVDGQIVARWNFADEMTRQFAPGDGLQATTLTLVNAPRRAVTGPEWSGTVHDWRQNPAHYDAIHFHEDDLSDCLWPMSRQLKLAPGLASGVYAIKLVDKRNTHYAPIFVRAPKARPLVFLASTFSYLAYANSLWASPSTTAIKAAYPEDAARLERYGLSMYSRHRDGSGIGLVSTRRPMLNVTPGFLGEGAGGQSLINDDLRILSWLDQQGEPYSIVTDHDLHAEGVAALDGCSVLITGTHPEYHSRETLDAIEAFQARSGRLIYMGGNGFYWRVSTLSDAPHVMEVRRAESGIRMWAEPTGEYHHQSDGGLGGLWRRIGRPPNRLTGVGYSAQGDEIESRAYRRTAEASNPRATFLFAGVHAETFGAGQDISAAGYEMDRADTRLGTPAHALVVARSEPFGDTISPVNEERLTHTVLDAEDPLRADLTFFETPSGGAVLSTGSVFFALALEDKDGAGRLIHNALKRFLDHAPFCMPKSETLT